jgi:hypothetical protein
MTASATPTTAMLVEVEVMLQSTVLRRAMLLSKLQCCSGGHKYYAASYAYLAKRSATVIVRRLDLNKHQPIIAFRVRNMK